jgi:hypothetical protein
MSEQSSEPQHEPSEQELQQQAQAAREALATSLARLDDRVKHMRSTAVNATAASGWGLAAACAWWLSFAIKPKREQQPLRRARPSLFATVLTTTLRTAGVVVTGALLYASYRRARQLADDQAAPMPAGQLTAGE